MTFLSLLFGIFRGQVLGIPDRGYRVPGEICPENPDSAATKLWARRTPQKSAKIEQFEW